jgi:solute carrier family 35 protein E1
MLPKVIVFALAASASAASLSTRAPALRLRGGGSAEGITLVPRVTLGASTLSSAESKLLVRGGAKKSAPVVAKATGGKVDVLLMAYFFFWYLLNYYYTLNNKRALTAAGGSKGFPMTVAFLQLVIGSVYGVFLWASPDSRVTPTTTSADLIKMLPIAFFFMAAHAFSVFSMGAGAVSFTQIVKAAEPAFAAIIGTTLYGKKVRTPRALPADD